MLEVDIAVEPGHAASFYAKNLKDAGKTLGGVLALQDYAEGSGLALLDGEGDVDASASVPGIVVVSSLAQAKAKPKPKLAPKRRSATKARPAPKRGDDVGGADADIDGAGEDATEVVRAFAVSRKHSLSLGSTVEGVDIASTEYTDESHNYARWYVRCPFANCKHQADGGEPCGKCRNTGAVQTKDLGIAEVYSYLGMWLRKGVTEPTRKDRMKYRSTYAEIRAYASEMGWAGSSDAL